MIDMRSTRTSSARPIETLRGLALFHDCSERDLKRIDRVSTRVRVESGRTLTREGRPGSEFFVLVEGAVTVTRREQTVNELGPGDAFGVISVVDRGARTATAVAAEPCELLVFNRAEFATLLTIVPRVGNELLRRAVVHLREVAPVEPQGSRRFEGRQAAG
jgi:CRP-like cAMP-binding protein